MTIRLLSRAVIFEDRLDASGVFVGRGRVSAVGVFPYTLPNGERAMVARLPEHVFEEASIESLRMAPITMRHPAQWLDTTNTKQFKVGHLGDSVQVVDGAALELALRIDDADAVRIVQSWQARELSPGYNADLVPQEGVFGGKAYTWIQTKIRYNHVAIEPRGRQGPQQRILDSADSLASGYERLEVEDENDGKERTMRKVKIGNVMVEVEDGVADQLEATERQRLADQGRLAAVPTRDAMEADIRGQMVARQDLETKAAGVLGKTWSPTGKNDRAIKVEVVKKALPHVAVTDATEEAFLDGLYSAALQAAPRADQTGAGRGTTAATQAAGTQQVQDAAEARKQNPHGLDTQHQDSDSLYDASRRAMLSRWRSAGTSKSTAS